jgi:CheY-like chemotaxis protein
MDPKKAKTLLIEDERVLCDMYKIKFEISGLKLLIANGGYEGLAMAKKEKPDLILLDIKMDDLGGFEVLKQLKADPKLSHIPVFLLTNMGEKGNADEGLQLGAEAYIMKSKTVPADIVNLVIARLNKI